MTTKQKNLRWMSDIKVILFFPQFDMMFTLAKKEKGILFLISSWNFSEQETQSDWIYGGSKTGWMCFLVLFLGFSSLSLWNCVQVKTHKRRIKSRGWMDYRSFVCVQLTPDEPRCALVSIKHHLITGCVFIIIIVIIIIIINRLPSLKSETMDSP